MDIIINQVLKYFFKMSFADEDAVFSCYHLVFYYSLHFFWMVWNIIVFYN